MTRRRWIADTWSPQSSHPTHAALTGEQAEHLARVLRAQPGQIFDVVANGFLHRAEVTAVSESEVSFALHEELEADTALPIHLLLAVFKFDHFEWAIEKATELGVARITPILARRTEKHLALAAPKRAERWRRIALEAAKQSRRTGVPEISEPASLSVAVASETAKTRILLSETEQMLTFAAALEDETDRATSFLHPTLRSVTPASNDRSPGTPVAAKDGAPEQVLGFGQETTLALAVGPEGGWTPEEMALFSEHGWTHVTLGPRILRAETAAIAAIAIAAALLPTNDEPQHRRIASGNRPS